MRINYQKLQLAANGNVPTYFKPEGWPGGESHPTELKGHEHT